jgi:hypothetical protein
MIQRKAVVPALTNAATNLAEAKGGLNVAHDTVQTHKAEQ